MTRAAWAVIALILSTTAVAAADDTPRERAREAFRVGKAAFAKRDFTQAAQAFELAAEYAPHPAPLLNALDAWLRAGELARAAEDCDRVLAMPASEPEHRAVANDALLKLSPRIGTVEVVGPSGVRVRLDDGAPFDLPARRRAMPGTHTIVVSTGKGETAPTTISVEAGKAQSLVGRLLPEGTLEPPTPRAEVAPRTESGEKARGGGGSSGPPAATWISFAAGGVALGAAGYFGLRTLDAKREFEATPTERNADAFDRSRLFTNVVLGAGVAAIVIGGVFWLVTPENGTKRIAERPLRITF